MRSTTTRGANAWMTAVVLGVLMSLTGCSSEEGPAHQVRPGQIEEVPAKAVSADRQVEIGLPTGVLKVKLNAGQKEASTPSGDLAPDDGVTLVGLAWSFEAHRSSEGRDVLLGDSSPGSLPKPTLSLLDGDEALALPADLPSGWDKGLIVGATDPSAFQVTYDGLTQSVDLDTGAIEDGMGDGLKDLDAASTTLDRRCPADAFVPQAAALDHGCGVRAVHVLPYLAGLGWTPDNQTWVVVDASIEGKATMRVGQDTGTELESPSADVHRIAFAAPNLPREVTFDFGPRISPISVSLSS